MQQKLQRRRIVALFMAITMVFSLFSGVGPLNVIATGGTGEVLFDLSTWLEGRDGEITDNLAPFVRGGSPVLTATGGALRITTTADWGEGVDIKPDGGFLAGDVITLTATGAALAPDGQLMLQINGGAAPWDDQMLRPLVNFSADEEINMTVTLTDDDITKIAAGSDFNSGNGIRIRANNPASGEFYLTSLTISRPGTQPTLTSVAAPNLAVTTAAALADVVTPSTVVVTADNGTTSLPVSWVLPTWNNTDGAPNIFTWTVNTTGYAIAADVVTSGNITVYTYAPVVAQPEPGDLVWEPNLVGATAATSGRNYVTNAAGQTLGFILSSSRTPPAGFTIVEDSILRHQSGGGGERMNIIVRGTGTGNPSVAGFAPVNGKHYRVTFNATDDAGAPVASLVFRPNDVATGAVEPVAGSQFSFSFTYDEATASNDGTHGRIAIAVVTGNAGTVVRYSNFRIYLSCDCDACGYCCDGENCTGCGYENCPVGSPPCLPGEMVPVYNLQSDIAGRDIGPLGSGAGAGTPILSTTHGVANTHLIVGEAEGRRHLLVNRTQASATRGLLFNFTFREGDVLELDGYLMTDGLEMRLQGHTTTGWMPSGTDMNRVGGNRVGEEDTAPFTIEYEIKSGDLTALSTGLRVIADGDTIAAQYRLYELKVLRDGACGNCEDCAAEPQTFEEAVTAVNDAIATIVPTNFVTEQEVKDTVEDAVEDHITVTWTSDVAIVLADVGVAGSITGVVTLSLDEESEVININLAIPSLSDGPIEFPPGVVYDLQLDDTLNTLPGGVADHMIFRASAGGTLSGVNNTGENNASVSLTNRTGNAHGIDICVEKLSELLVPGRLHRFEIEGTAGVQSNSGSATRFVRPGASGAGSYPGDPLGTANHVTSGTRAGGAFTLTVALSYEYIAAQAASGTRIYRIGTNSGDTNTQNLVVTKLLISYECCDGNGCEDCCKGDECEGCDYCTEPCPVHTPIWALDYSRAVPGGLLPSTGNPPIPTLRQPVGNPDPNSPYRPGIQSAQGANVTNVLDVAGDALTFTHNSFNNFFILGSDQGTSTGFWSEDDGFSPVVDTEYRIAFDAALDGGMALRIAPNNTTGLNAAEAEWTYLLQGGMMGSVSHTWKQTVAPGASGNGAIRIGLSGSTLTTVEIKNLRIYEVTDEDCTCGNLEELLIWPIGNTQATLANHERISVIGAGNSRILRFEIDPRTESLLRDNIGASLEFTPINSTISVNRALAVWTDLSGENTDNFEFAVNEEALASGLIVRSPDFDPRPSSVNLRLTSEMLYKDGEIATAIYVLLSQGHGAWITNPRADNLEMLGTATLTMLSANPTNISLNIGANESEMSFTWWTPSGIASGAAVQVAPYASLVDGQMPAEAALVFGEQDFTLTNLNLPAYAFDVSRVTVQSLELNTKYAYRVGDGRPGTWSEIHYFNTFNPTESHTVMVVGDPQIGAWNLGRQEFKWTDGIERAITRAAMPEHGSPHNGIDFILNTGDVISPANNIDRMNVYMRPAHLRSIPVFTTVGNHDSVSQGDGLPTLGLLSLIHNWPNHNWLGGNPTSIQEQRRGGGNHFFSYGDVLYISLNTNVVDRAAHRATLEAARASHQDAKWTIAIFHQDVFGNGTGHALGMPGSNRQRMLYDLYANGVDLVINGHEHTHSRSLFMDGRVENTAANSTRQPFMDQRPANFGGNITERLVFDPHPGAFIAPVGIPFITTGSVSDFPKYTSIFPVTPWTAWTDPAEYDNFQNYSIMTVDGDSLTIETFVVPYTTGANNATDWRPTGEPEIMSNSLTLRRTARFEDLQLLIDGTDELAQGNITNDTWAEFQDKITLARILTEVSEASDIHKAYMAIYDAYYSLVNDADFEKLDALVKEVAAVLAEASEGIWEGQYQDGSIAELRAIFEPAELVNSVRLSSQGAIDAQYALLRPAYEEFKLKISDISRPWVHVHEIPADEVYTMNLLHWMDETIMLNMPWERHEDVWPRYFAHFTKRNFAGGSFGNNYTAPLVNVPAFGTILRNDARFGPVNALGGRGLDTGIENAGGGHITRTHVGEWIRYELNVVEAGEYRVRLGAINPQNAVQRVLLRDMSYNTLTSFTIPRNHANNPNVDWADAPMIPAANNIFLPEGKFIIEMLFANGETDLPHAGPTPVSTGIPSNYPDGANVDIITFERIGDMEPTVFEIPDNHFILPLPPNDAAGTSRRQRGWGTVGVGNEWGGVRESSLSLRAVGLATHLVLEVAGRPPGNVDVVLAGDERHPVNNPDGVGTWNQQTFTMHTTSSVTGIFNAANNTVTIDLRLMDGHASNGDVFTRWSDVENNTSARRIIVSHNSDTWDELNVIRAYLVLSEAYEETVEPTGLTATTPTTVTMTVGGTANIGVSLYPENWNVDGYEVVWSTPSSIVTTSGSGLTIEVTGIEKGATTITAQLVSPGAIATDRNVGEPIIFNIMVMDGIPLYENFVGDDADCDTLLRDSEGNITDVVNYNVAVAAVSGEIVVTVTVENGPSDLEHYFNASFCLSVRVGENADVNVPIQVRVPSIKDGTGSVTLSQEEILAAWGSFSDSIEGRREIAESRGEDPEEINWEEVIDNLEIRGAEVIPVSEEKEEREEVRQFILSLAVTVFAMTTLCFAGTGETTPKDQLWAAEAAWEDALKAFNELGFLEVLGAADLADSDTWNWNEVSFGTMDIITLQQALATLNQAIIDFKDARDWGKKEDDRKLLIVPTGRQAVFHLSKVDLTGVDEVEDIVGLQASGLGDGAEFTFLGNGAINVKTGTTNYAGTFSGIDVVPGEFDGLKPGDTVQAIIELVGILPSAAGATVNNGFRIEQSIGREHAGLAVGARLHPIATGNYGTITIENIDQAWIDANADEWNWVGTSAPDNIDGRGRIGEAVPPRFRIAGHFINAHTGNEATDGTGGSEFIVHDILVHRAEAQNPAATLTQVAAFPGLVQGYSQEVANNATRGFTIQNTGGVALNGLTVSITSGGANFVIAGDSTFNIPVGGQATVNVRPVLGLLAVGSPHQGTLAISFGGNELATAQLSVAVTTQADPPVISTASLPAGTVGQPYGGTGGFQLVGTGSNLSWSAEGLPASLTVSGTGLITGTPIEADIGTHPVTITLTGASGTTPAEVTLDLVINAAGSFEVTQRFKDIVARGVILGDITGDGTFGSTDVLLTRQIANPGHSRTAASTLADYPNHDMVYLFNTLQGQVLPTSVSGRFETIVNRGVILGDITGDGTFGSTDVLLTRQIANPGHSRTAASTLADYPNHDLVYLYAELVKLLS
ncbi:MAG: metallophosphoesterase [Defluviitaleaceae bacterium]|nr:metallophosphoesterase [Defluviitaleaceae bacterium]